MSTAASNLTRTERAAMRYMAARYPHLPLRQLAEAVHAELGRPDITVGDLRLVLLGRSVLDPVRRVERTTLEAIQTCGDALRRGGSLAAAARASGLGIDTARAIDRVVGLRAQRRAAVAAAVRHAREHGASIRAVAHNVGLSRGTAHRIILREEGS